MVQPAYHDPLAAGDEGPLDGVDGVLGALDGVELHHGAVAMAVHTQPDNLAAERERTPDVSSVGKS